MSIKYDDQVYLFISQSSLLSCIICFKTTEL